jgi:hypothetical protein
VCQTPPFTHASVRTHARNPARYAPCCVHAEVGVMRVEAESISSHGAAIVAFEASGLARAVLSLRTKTAVTAFTNGEESEARVPKNWGEQKGNKKGNKMRLEYREGTKISKDLCVMDEGNACTRAPPQFAAPSASSQP